MCPRATAQQGGVAMARAAAAFAGAAASVHYSFREEEYIDLDLSSCGEFEFRVRRSSGDELLCRGGVVAAAAAPHKAVTKSSGAKTQEADAPGGGCGGGGGRRSAATVAPLQHSHSAGFCDAPTPTRVEGSRRRKAARTVQAKLQASRAFFRLLFARTSCSDERRHGASVQASTTRATPYIYGDAKRAAPFAFGEIKNGYRNGSMSASTSFSRTAAAPTTLRSSIEQEKLMDEEEHAARQRKSFSGVIRWRHATTTFSPAPAPAKPLSSSSARRSSGGGIIGPAHLKRSNSTRSSESEGLIQGAIAYCKRSQLQQQLGLARKSDAAAALRTGPPCPSDPTRSAAPDYCCYYY